LQDRQVKTDLSCKSTLWEEPLKAQSLRMLP